MLKCLFQLLLNLHPKTEMLVWSGNPTVYNFEFIAAFHLLLLSYSGGPMSEVLIIKTNKQNTSVHAVIDKYNYFYEYIYTTLS